MPATVERLPQGRVRYTVTVTDDQRKLAEERALKRMGQGLKLDGFREGRAPLDVVRKQVKPEALLEETVRMLAPDLMTAAMDENHLKPIIAPKISVTSQEPLTVELIFVEKPVVKLTKPDSIKLPKQEPPTIGAKEVDEFLGKILAQDRVETPVDRAAEKGDMVRMHLSAVNLDGSPMEELNNLPFNMLAGTDDIIPGLGDALIGVKTGDTKSISPVFTDDHQVTILRGKKIKLDAKITSVASVALPASTAEFIKSRMGMDRTPAEFRTGIEQALTEQNKLKFNKDREEAFFDLVRKAAKVDIAPELLDAEVQNMLGDLQQSLARESTSIDDWLKQSGKSPKQVLDEMRDIAQSRITLRFGLQEFMKHKDVKIDDAALQKTLTQAKELAKRDGRPISDDDLKPDGELYSQALWELQVRTVMAGAMGE